MDALRQPDHVAQVVADYAQREPGESDRWTPLNSALELRLRLCLLYSLRQALTRVRIAPQTLRVLDVGCGTGRSSRLFIDLGLRPEQVTAVDLRPGALALAKKLNPAIRYLLYDGYSALDDGSSSRLISTIAVFSSIRSRAGRQCLADRVVEALPPGGYVFYFDLFRANDFAGRDWLRPRRLFPSCAVVWHRWFWSVDFIPRRERARMAWDALQRRDTMQRPSVRSYLARRLLPAYEVLCCRAPGAPATPRVRESRASSPQASPL